MSHKLADVFPFGKNEALSETLAVVAKASGLQEIEITRLLIGILLENNVETALPRMTLFVIIRHLIQPNPTAT